MKPQRLAATHSLVLSYDLDKSMQVIEFEKLTLTVRQTPNFGGTLPKYQCSENDMFTGALTVKVFACA